MIDFSTLQGLTIPEGVVTQITDSTGRVIWAVQNNKPVVLQVEKITSDTYAGETLYEGEQFVLLDIYPNNANSTVKVTYGGLTKTLKFSGTNARQVYFGTFNGVSDDVATPASGILTIEGECNAFGTGSFSISSNKLTGKAHCSCITNVNVWGSVKNIPAYGFYECKSITITTFPEGLINIGDYAFNMPIPHSEVAMAGTTITFPSTIESIGASAFAGFIYVSDGYLSYIKEIVMLSKIPPKVSSDTFGAWDYTTGNSAEGREPIKITVPKGCGEAYKTAEIWSEHASMIVEASE